MMHKQYDTIVLGAGIAGTTLATILAKNGHRVLMLEKESHPRFAIGESLVFRGALWLWLLGQQYDIPEITNLSHIDTLAEHVSPGCGFKLTFGFLYHREGQEQNPRESNKIIPPIVHFISDSHLYRQDVDHYMVKAAQKYGAAYRDRVTVTNIDTDDDGVTVEISTGEQFSARFLVDGTGYRSPLARRVDPAGIKTQSRAIFTHMKNVPAYDDIAPGGTPPAAKMSATWHGGTLHHVFDGGWMWMIPFDNHDQTSSNLCSVGLMLDPRRFPVDEALTPQEEFEAIVARFPTIARQLQGATPARPFVRTGRIQYSAESSLGPRHFLLHHAHSFIDPLYSRGMIRAWETVYALSSRLLAALHDDDFTPERFAYLDTMQAFQFRRTDQLVSNAYRSMPNFQMWNAWLHLWMGNELLTALYLWRRALKYMQSGDKAYLAGLDESPKPCMGAPFAPGVQVLYDRCESLLDRVDAGEISYEAAADALLAALKQADFLPHVAFDFGSGAATHADFVPQTTIAKILLWGKLRAPEAMRREVFDLPLRTVMKVEVGARWRPLRRRWNEALRLAPPRELAAAASSAES
ncbi:MAG: FAD-dependent oxidoreductase [Anaerolineales bacterium]|nr:FAD-dependent oxidoreductase [Anaerolineales bacterium]